MEDHALAAINASLELRRHGHWLGAGRHGCGRWRVSRRAAIWSSTPPGRGDAAAAAGVHARRHRFRTRCALAVADGGRGRGPDPADVAHHDRSRCLRARLLGRTSEDDTGPASRCAGRRRGLCSPGALTRCDRDWPSRRTSFRNPSSSSEAGRGRFGSGPFGSAVGIVVRVEPARHRRSQTPDCQFRWPTSPVRTGRTREGGAGVRLLVTMLVRPRAYRAFRAFPRPAAPKQAHVMPALSSVGTALWRWSDVERWLAASIGEETTAMEDHALAAINASLELRRHGHWLGAGRHGRLRSLAGL